MKIGALKHQVSFQDAAIVARDGGVQWTTRWVTWGSLETLYASTSEKTRLSLEQNATHRLVIRYDPGCYPVCGMRVLLGNKSYLVRMVTNDDEADSFVSILLKECSAFDSMNDQA